MIKVSFRVENTDIDLYGETRAFARAVAEWEGLPWVKFLREHGTIVNADYYCDLHGDCTHHMTFWELPPELETWFYLTYSDVTLSER